MGGVSVCPKASMSFRPVSSSHIWYVLGLSASPAMPVCFSEERSCPSTPAFRNILNMVGGLQRVVTRCSSTLSIMSDGSNFSNS